MMSYILGGIILVVAVSTWAILYAAGKAERQAEWERHLRAMEEEQTKADALLERRREARNVTMNTLTDDGEWED